MLEVGCGAGRMTGSFASLFETVYALDISQEMIQVAKSESGAVLEFVFSYFVMQHLPTEDLALAYIREMLRVLKGG